MRKVVQAICCVVLCWMLTGCATVSQLVNDDSVLQGTVKDVTPRVDGAGGSVLVSGFFYGTDVPKPGLVSLGLDENTRIVDQRMGETGTTSAALITLVKGQKVRAEISGPVMETYPVRATAACLIILP